MQEKNIEIIPKVEITGKRRRAEVGRKGRGGRGKRREGGKLRRERRPPRS